MKLIPVSIVLIPVLLGCATGPGPEARGPTPSQVVKSGTATSGVHWGGQIVRTENLHDRTLIEVLEFPLDSGGRPQTGRPPGGRFIIESPGFLEPHEYAPKRLIEVRGQLSGFRNGRVGEAEYRYPLVMAERLTLRAERAPASTPQFRFGFGSSSWGSGSGIGIRF
jgi:outer membrane lipoprotein